MTMKKPLEVWHLILTSLILLGGVGGFILTQQKEMENQRVRLNLLESQQTDIKLQFRDNNQQFRMIDEKLTNILIILQNKEDRKSESKH